MRNTILVFDNNRWEPMATPGAVYIRSFAAKDGVICSGKVRNRAITCPRRWGIPAALIWLTRRLTLGRRTSYFTSDSEDC